MQVTHRVYVLSRTDDKSQTIGLFLDSAWFGGHLVSSQAICAQDPVPTVITAGVQTIYGGVVLPPASPQHLRLLEYKGPEGTELPGVVVGEASLRRHSWLFCPYGLG